MVDVCTRTKYEYSLVIIIIIIIIIIVIIIKRAILKPSKTTTF